MEKQELKKSSKFHYKVVMDPNPTLMAKCIDLTLSIPTLRTKFRNGAQIPQGGQL